MHCQACISVEQTCLQAQVPTKNDYARGGLYELLTKECIRVSSEQALHHVHGTASGDETNPAAA